MATEKEAVETPKEEISSGIQERIAKNRERALLLRKAKVVAHPSPTPQNENATQGKVIKVQGQKVIDSGAGFLIDENDELEAAMCNITPDPAPIVSKLPVCLECKKEFKDSFLLQKFDYLACDECS